MLPQTVSVSISDITSSKCNSVACGVSSLHLCCPPPPPHCQGWLSWLCLARTCLSTPQTATLQGRDSRAQHFKKTGNMAKSLRGGLWSQSALETESTIRCMTLGKSLNLSVSVSSSVKGERNSNLQLLGGINEMMHMLFSKCSNNMAYPDAKFPLPRSLP